jgi:uncharacterized SAM-binding protein YcdF (DUF218 family)
MRRLAKWLWRLVLAMCVVTASGVVWVAGGGRLFVDQWLDVTESPAPAAAIIVLAGGTNGRNVPLAQGWDRLVTANELFADRWAPTVVLSGGGTTQVAESEIYANAAAWLGIPREAMILESKAQGTRDHGAALLGTRLPGGSVIDAETPLLVVTSAFHSRRALLSFHRAGFDRVRVVANYTARRGPDSVAAPTGAPSALTSSVPDHQPSGKRYDDPLFRLAYRSYDLFMGLREASAIVVESR